MVSAVAAATLPYVELVRGNLDEPLATTRLAAYWAVTVVVAAAAIWAVAERDRRAARRTAVLVVVAFWLFFNYPLIEGVLARVGLASRYHLVGWLGASLVVLLAARPLARRPGVQVYVTIAISALVLVAVGGVAAHGFAGSELPDPTRRGAATVERRPNIYYVVLDGYARADVVEEVTGFSIAPFLRELEARGFDVGDAARANYPLTYLSLASTLDMAYLVDESDEVTSRTPFYERLRGHNATVGFLTDQGYRYVHVEPSGWSGNVCSGLEDTCIGDPGPLNETERGLLRKTPLGGLVDRIVSAQELHARQTDPARLVRAHLSRSPAQPHFVFAHVMAPHPPFLREADCTLRPSGIDLTRWSDPGHYADAVSCLNRQLLAAIDLVLAEDPEALIVLQGDHGSAFGVDFGAASGVDQRLRILSAARLPDGCGAMPDDVTSVNTFRVVLACLRGEAPELLEDRFYWVGYSGPGVREVHPAP